MVRIMDEIISYKMCAVKVRNAKLRNYLNSEGGIQEIFQKLKNHMKLVQTF